VATAPQPEFRELTWIVPESKDAPHIIRAEGRDIGSLWIDRGDARRAVGEVHGRRWILERTSQLYPRVTIHEEGSSEPLAIFTPGLTGGGVVSFAGGAEYCWNPSHVWSTTWCFRSGGKKASLCVSEQTPQKTGARVRMCAEAVQLPEMPVLLLLGWYLRRLALERLGVVTAGVS
jgi:hypothetical protein